MAPTSSGSARSERAVKSTRSQNSTVTRRRSSVGAGAGPVRGAPQLPQNRKPPGLSCPQTAHRGMEAVYGAATSRGGQGPGSSGGRGGGGRGRGLVPNALVQLGLALVAADQVDGAAGQGEQHGQPAATV